MEEQTQLSRICEPRFKPAVPGRHRFEESLADDRLDRSVRAADQGLENRIDQGGDRHATARRDDGDFGSLVFVRLDQDQRATWFQMTSGPPQGMDHALQSDSSK